ncbi:MAG TPA: tetratricopeptide repeat protein [Thermoanaerobaculia bacterium]|nr:tetratricopeptide repeat protein [Thermoanaerobaculia bacterium]
MKPNGSFGRRTWTACGLALLLATVGCNKFQSRSEIRAGNELFRVGKYDTALAKYDHALQLDPGEKKIYKNIGLAYMGLYQPGSKHPKDLEYAQKAIDYLKKYVEAYPDDKKTPEYLVTMYLNSGRVDDALAFFQSYSQQHPEDAKAKETMANLYFQKADFPNGVRMMEEAMKITGPKKETYETIGAQAWDKAHNYPDLTDEQRQAVITQGIDAENKALAIDPNYPEALAFINLLYREQAKLEQKNDPQKAAEDIAKADEYRNKAIEINKQKAAEKAAKAAPGK